MISSAARSYHLNLNYSFSKDNYDAAHDYSHMSANSSFRNSDLAEQLTRAVQQNLALIYQSWWHKNGRLVGLMAVQVDDFLRAGDEFFNSKIKLWLGCTFNVDKEENTVEPFNSGHHWFSKIVSAKERCPLKRGKFQ